MWSWRRSCSSEERFSPAIAAFPLPFPLLCRRRGLLTGSLVSLEMSESALVGTRFQLSRTKWRIFQKMQ